MYMYVVMSLLRLVETILLAVGQLEGTVSELQTKAASSTQADAEVDGDETTDNASPAKPPAYIMVDTKISNSERYEEYKALAKPIVRWS